MYNNYNQYMSPELLDPYYMGSMPGYNGLHMDSYNGYASPYYQQYGPVPDPYGILLAIYNMSVYKYVRMQGLLSYVYSICTSGIILFTMYIV